MWVEEESIKPRKLLMVMVFGGGNFLKFFEFSVLYVVILQVESKLYPLFTVCPMDG